METTQTGPVNVEDNGEQEGGRFVKTILQVLDLSFLHVVKLLTALQDLFGTR